MSKTLPVLIPALALSLFLVGCESANQPEDLRPVPEASLDPSGLGGEAGGQVQLV